MIRLLHAVMLFAVASAVQTCSQPAPIPTPDPVVDAAPRGPFDALIVNCGEVRPQIVAARPAVEVCLATQICHVLHVGSQPAVEECWDTPSPADGCMIDLLSTWGPGPLACAVRAAGMASFALIHTDAGTNIDQFMATSSRLWITSHGIGYKD